MWPAWGLHKQQVWMYLANLAYGVTTTRDPQTSSTDVITYGDLVEAGEVIGPRVYSTGPGVFGDYVLEAIEDREHADRILKAYSEYYDTKTIKMYMAGNRQQRQWVIAAAKEQGLMPTTEGGLRAQYDLTLALDGYSGLEHSFPIYPIYDDVVTLFAESGIVYTPTLLVAYGGPWGEQYFWQTSNPHDDPKLNRFVPHRTVDAKARRHPWIWPEEYHFPVVARGVAEVARAGGNVSLGAHGQLQGLGAHWELWAMAGEGDPQKRPALRPIEALRAATLAGADKIGLAPDLGSIEPGKLADLVALDANPLDDIKATAKVRWVVKNGVLYEGETLEEQWPEKKPLPPFFWKKD
jgi:hypothetical protein